MKDVKLNTVRQQLVQAALACGALQLGNFTLKSGRPSPYFFNAGKFLNEGGAWQALCQAYAAVLEQRFAAKADVVFGPAYKGIPLAAGILASVKTMPVLANKPAIRLGMAFDRKEEKDHGEGGLLVGADMQGKRVLIVDDVLTAGKASGHAATLVQQAGGMVVGLLIAMDREEWVTEADKTVSAAQAFTNRTGVPVASLLTANSLADTLASMGQDYAPQVAAIRSHLATYGMVK
ncbi:MAG: orotate phosphoribosyltransferase [Alphaproteobacteria bacterium]